MSKLHEDVQGALAAIGLPGLRVVADKSDIAALEQSPDCKVRFGDALRNALEAFLSNGSGSLGQGHDSALDVVRSQPESFALGADPSDSEITEALRTLLADDASAQIVLLTPTTIQQREYRFLPEYGESITENWVFRIIAPSNWPLLQWSIVDIRGETRAYSYEFD